MGIKCDLIREMLIDHYLKMEEMTYISIVEVLHISNIRFTSTLLPDEDRPFLMALYITMFSGEKTTEEAIDFFYSDQTDRCFSPGGLNFPLSPDRIPVSFTIKGGIITSVCVIY